MEIDKRRLLVGGLFAFFFIVTSIGAIATGEFLDRLVSYRNGVRWFLSATGGFFLLTLIPFIVLINATYKRLIVAKPVRDLEKVVAITLFLGLIFGAASYHASPMTNVEFDQAIVHHVIVVTFDGTRYDVFRQATERIQEMKSISARAEYAVSTFPTTTYPSHTTIFTGTTYITHGVKKNAYFDVKAETIFDVLSDYGYKNAIVTPVSTLASMLAAKSGYSPTSVYTGNEYADMSVATDKVIELLDEGYNFIRLHYVESDETGHLYGADSEEYKAVIAAQQMELKRIVDHLNATGMREDTVIIVTADHGMFVNKHHNIRPSLVDHVPFIIMGGKVKPMELPHVSTIDIAPTVAMLLGVRVPAEAVGIAIGEPFGMPNVRCDVGSLRTNLLISAIAAAFLRTSLSVVILNRFLKVF